MQYVAMQDVVSLMTKDTTCNAQTRTIRATATPSQIAEQCKIKSVALRNLTLANN